MSYPASYAIGLVAPWLVLLLLASAGVNTGDALGSLGPSSVVGALWVGVIAVHARRLRIRPRPGDAALYLVGIGFGALVLLPVLLVVPVLAVGETQFDQLSLAPSIAACCAVGALAFIGELIVGLAARARSRGGR